MTTRPTTDIQAAIRALELFNEKADKLESSTFTKKILGERSGVEIEAKQGEGVSVIRFGPDQEAIEAFVLTLRFFVQDNEPSSFRNLATLYNDPNLNLDTQLVRRFQEARDAINSFLDQRSLLQENKSPLTHRAIFEIFMWGGLAHANEEKKKTFDRYRGIPIFFQILENEFVITLASILKAIFYIRELNKETLGKLRP